MISVDSYREQVLAGAEPLPAVRVPLSDARGFVLAEDVVAAWSLPSFENSSMDGYAVVSADLQSLPTTLTVLGDIAAGSVSDQVVSPGTTLRIMTGAPMPAGADSVVPVEKTDGGATTVEIREGVDVGAHIRHVGEDVRAGDVVLAAGASLTSRQLAVLAAVGCSHVLVHRQPIVAVLSTGSELVEPGVDPAPGMITDSNSYMLVAACIEAGADAYRVPPIVDDHDAFLSAVREAAATADLILTSGGVSMGVYDTVKAVFNDIGSVEFCKVAMQPGMPQGFGSVDGTKIITLPGNPVSSYVSFENFVRPVILRMRGERGVVRQVRTATLTEAFNSPAKKRQFVRAQIVGDRVTPVGSQGSHVMGGLALSNCLIVVDEDVTHVAEGSIVHVIEFKEQ